MPTRVVLAALRSGEELVQIPQAVMRQAPQRVGQRQPSPWVPVRTLHEGMLAGQPAQGWPEPGRRDEATLVVDGEVWHEGTVYVRTGEDGTVTLTWWPDAESGPRYLVG